MDELTGPWDFSRPTAGGRVHAVAAARLQDGLLRIDVANYDRRRALTVHLESMLEGRFEIAGADAEPLSGRVSVALQPGSRVVELTPDAFPSAMVWTLQRLTEF